MGDHARGRPRILPELAVSGHIPRALHSHRRPCHQPDGRRPARCARSKAEEILMPLLDIENLTVEFQTSSGLFRAVDSDSLGCDKGEILSIVGESGSGKSVSMLAVMG